jgi:two-component system, OmpR family, response regulator
MNARTILIVDDDRDQRTALDVRLKAGGYRVVGAADAVQAIAVGRKEKPDLVLLDIGLPGGDGLGVLKRLRSMTSTSTVPVVVLSAMDPASYRDRMLAAGAVAYFQKPADFKALLTVIREALGEPVAPAATAAPAAAGLPRASSLG